MKNIKLLLLFFSVSLQSQSLTLEQCYQLARENYPLIKRNDLITKTQQFNLENLSKGWFPQIQIIGQATYQNDVTQIPVTIPGVKVLSKDQYKVFGDLTQNIYDGGMIHHQKKLTKENSEIQIQQNEVELDKLKERINQLYFGILQTDEQIDTTKLTENDIDNGLKKAEAQLKNGVIFRSNVDLLKAQKIVLQQKIVELSTVRKNFLDVLSLFINQKIDENADIQKPDKLLLSNENNRAELKLFDLQKLALDSQKSLVNSKNTPKINAFFQGGYGKPGYNMLKDQFDWFYIGGIRLNIPISGFYTKKNDLNLLKNQQQDIEIQRENFLFNQNLQTTQNKNELEKIQNLLDKDDELISLRQSIKKASLAQLENGVITTNDYIQNVNSEEQAKIQKIQHEIQYLLTQYNLKANLNN